MNIALYARVSTDGQSTDMQLAELRQWAARAGHHVAHELRDDGISGSKGRDRRPAFDRLHKLVARREVAMVAAWSVDRLGRSMPDLVAFLHELRGAGVALYLHQQALDTSTPAGAMMFQLLGVFAEFERALIVARVRSGLDRARAAGVQLGRPRVGEDVAQLVRQLREDGASIGRIAGQLRIGRGTIARILAGR